MMNTKIKCPVCGKETGWQENAFRPFCSERCSLIDLGKWADGKYSVEVEQESKEEQGEKDDE